MSNNTKTNTSEIRYRFFETFADGRAFGETSGFFTLDEVATQIRAVSEDTGEGHWRIEAVKVITGAHGHSCSVVGCTADFPECPDPEEEGGCVRDLIFCPRHDPEG